MATNDYYNELSDQVRSEVSVLPFTVSHSTNGCAGCQIKIIIIIIVRTVIIIFFSCFQFHDYHADVVLLPLPSSPP